MIANLFHAPVGDDEAAVGVGTVGSSEAIMLAGLAFKRKWQHKRRSQCQPFDKPNIVTGANVQVLFKYYVYIIYAWKMANDLGEYIHGICRCAGKSLQGTLKWS